MKCDLRIDGDVLDYRAGYAADSRSDELSHSLHNTKLIINMLRKRFPGDMTIYLSSRDPKVNFRTSLVKNYKLNRLWSDCCDAHVTKRNNRCYCLKCKEICETVSKKPRYYLEIREYLIKRFGAIVIDWGEADDWLCVHPKKNTVVASIDKDLLMVPGCYNFRMQNNKLLKAFDPGRLWLSEDNKKILGVGFMWFCAQLILGDTADNIIKPKSGIGPPKVFKMFKQDSSKLELWTTILEYYDKFSTREQLAINSQLLWIAREPRQRWSWELMEEITEK